MQIIGNPQIIPRQSAKEKGLSQKLKIKLMAQPLLLFSLTVFTLKFS